MDSKERARPYTIFKGRRGAAVINDAFWQYSIGEVAKCIAPKYIEQNLPVIDGKNKTAIETIISKVNTFVYDLQ